MKIFAACILTVIIETVFFRLFAVKGREELTIVALANIITNLVLNLFLAFFPDAYGFPWLLILELAVVASEYLIYRSAFGGSAFLLLMTAAANAISYGVGAAIQAFELF